jgi:hypothetical protein
VVDSFHRYLGVAVGECLGYLGTGAWTMLVAIAMLQSSMFADWLAWPGILVGALLVIGSLEFVGRLEEHGWKLAGTIVPIATPLVGLASRRRPCTPLRVTRTAGPWLARELAPERAPQCVRRDVGVSSLPDLRPLRPRPHASVPADDLDRPRDHRAAADRPASWQVEQTYRLDGEPRRGRAPLTVVFRRRDGEWKIVLMHVVALPERA